MSSRISRWGKASASSSWVNGGGSAFGGSTWTVSNAVSRPTSSKHVGQPPPGASGGIRRPHLEHLAGFAMLGSSVNRFSPFVSGNQRKGYGEFWFLWWPISRHWPSKFVTPLPEQQRRGRESTGVSDSCRTEIFSTTLGWEDQQLRSVSKRGYNPSAPPVLRGRHAHPRRYRCISIRPHNLVSGVDWLPASLFQNVLD